MNEPQVQGGPRSPQVAESEVEQLRRELSAHKVALLRAEADAQEANRLLSELTSSHQRLSALVDGTLDFVCSVDKNLQLTLYNAAFETLWYRLSDEPLRTGVAVTHLLPEKARKRFAELLVGGFRGERFCHQENFECPDLASFEMSISPILVADEIEGVALVGRDISVRKAKEGLDSDDESHLLELSRLAGMSEVASDVLHNVGNVLNSVNISVGIVTSRIEKLPIEALARLATLLKEQPDLAKFLTEDSRGKVLPDLVARLADLYGKEREALRTETRGLKENVHHIANIISSQQKLGKSLGKEELLSPKDLITSALGINSAAFVDNAIQVSQELDDVAPFPMDRHIILQILVNLLSNARHALRDSASMSKQLVVRLKQMEDRVRFEVQDNGVGISEENMNRIFTHGFTTKRDGHGFGLHSAINAAKAMGGSLSAESEGEGKGARFVLELPKGED